MDTTEEATSRKRKRSDEKERPELRQMDATEEATSRKRKRSDEKERPELRQPPELASVGFSTDRISWGKYHPYTERHLDYVPVGTEPTFQPNSPALTHHVNAVSGRARACTVHLKPQPGGQATPVHTPVWMPVGTRGCLKAVTMQELTTDPALSCPIILANTYHLALQPGTELIDQLGGLHKFQGVDRIGDSSQPYNLLTDSGGFQMVSLVKLSEVTEEGVSFENPYSKNKAGSREGDEEAEKDMLLLRPEDSIRHQNEIGANIIMALDDVVSSVNEDEERFVTATYRTLRWYDRCYQAHAKNELQNLFPIVQGGLDTSKGGLREQCLAGFCHRQEELGYITPGYAIGGLAGGEGKDSFWKVVDQCCRALPDDKPRYLMGVGYPLDLVVCVALGIDLFDCVYPTRTGRFGVALVPGPAPGTLRLKGHECAHNNEVIQKDCCCQACREGISRARLHTLFKAGNPLAVELITQHNVAYMMALVRRMREAILEDRFADFANNFVKMQYPGKECGCEDVPRWVIDALDAAGIKLST
jgi:queuine tRNA-ribosyltransferase